MKKELQEYLKENRSADDIKRFIQELVDSPSAEDVYDEMALAITELNNIVNTVRREVGVQ